MSGGGKWVSHGSCWHGYWVARSRWVSLSQASWRRRGQQCHGVGEWVFDFLYRLSISHFPFFLSFFLRFLLSSFGFGMLRAEGVFFLIILFKIYMGHGLLGWLDDG